MEQEANKEVRTWLDMVSNGNLKNCTSYTGKEIKDTVRDILRRGQKSIYYEAPNSENMANPCDKEIIEDFWAAYTQLTDHPICGNTKYFVCWRHASAKPKLILIKDRNQEVKTEDVKKD